MMVDFLHETVLRAEAVAALRPFDGGRYVDCTLGGGGHSLALLEAARCEVLGVDRDPAALEAAGERLADHASRFTAARGRFSELGRLLDDHGWSHVDGILADLGVSSPQLDQASRGFSFRSAGPVDMRMDPDADLTALEIVSTWSEADLARIIRDYGEERHARRVARMIVADRPWSDTVELAEAIARVVGRGKGRIHPATRTFQALRIAVNDELGEVERMLPVAIDRLAPGGRIAIITFHSLEDRIVKQCFATASGKNLPRDPWGNPIGPILLERPDPATTPPPNDPNPRARSARLRAATRLAWKDR